MSESRYLTLLASRCLLLVKPWLTSESKVFGGKRERQSERKVRLFDISIDKYCSLF